MPLASQSSSSNAAAAAAAGEADSVREHARNMVKMADMTIMSTEKVERKAVEGVGSDGGITTTKKAAR